MATENTAQNVPTTSKSSTLILLPSPSEPSATSNKLARTSSRPSRMKPSKNSKAKPHAAKDPISSAKHAAKHAEKSTDAQLDKTSNATHALTRSSSRRPRYSVHKRTNMFSKPVTPENTTASKAKTPEPYEIIQEELALLREECRFSNNSYFKMGAAVAVSGLFDLGKLGYQPRVAEDIRHYLKSFGIRSLEDARRLGINGICLTDLEMLYAM